VAQIQTLIKIINHFALRICSKTDL